MDREFLANMMSSNVTQEDTMLKSQMTSGEWYVVVEGLTFAWMRSFQIIAGPPKIVTETPTVTVNVTVTPTSTITTTITSVDVTTLPASTTTVPFSTKTKTVHTTPARVTTTSTSKVTKVKTTRTLTQTTVTTTVTTSCQVQTPVRDPPCTIRPSKASLKAASVSVSATPVPRNRHWSSSGKNLKQWIRDAMPEPVGDLEKRSPGMSDALKTSDLSNNKQMLVHPQRKLQL
jgi:hypothetical protein